MPGYLGSLGALTPIGCVAALTGEATRPVTYETTLGGRTFAQVGVAAPRTWSLSFPDGARPVGPAQVQAFLDGEHGLGPWWWINEWAQVTNVLPPRVAAGEFGWSNSSDGGAATLDDGTIAGRSATRLAANPPSYLRDANGVAAIPVVPGRPVTASAWVRRISGAVSFVLQWRNRDGANIGDNIVSVPGTVWGRMSVSRTPPAAATHAYLAATGTCQIARPAVTWTPELTPYSGGHGAPAVLIDQLRHDPTIATARQQLGAATYSVHEVA